MGLGSSFDYDLGLLADFQCFDRIGVVVNVFNFATCQFDHDVFGQNSCFGSRPVFGNPREQHPLDVALGVIGNGAQISR